VGFKSHSWNLDKGNSTECWKPKGEFKNIGWIDKEIRELVEKLTGFRIKNPIIAVNDKGILHMIRNAKEKNHYSFKKR